MDDYELTHVHIYIMSHTRDMLLTKHTRTYDIQIIHATE